ncbi:MAG TPA: DUF5916 domain-containing protein [Longimicrobiaceae bacterium]|nr:DUF5916 domain-containing protein [Longimicrobiaceae bacterium]
MQSWGRWTPWACAVLLLAALPGRAQGPAEGSAPAAAAPTARAARIEGAPPTVDGRLDDAAWAQAEPVTGFVQRTPRSGAPASERTEVRVLYGPDALYVGARMHDSAPDSVAGQLTRRDTQVYSDWFSVGVDSHADGRTGFLFAVNPRGVKRDVLLFNDTDEDSGWDAVWEAAARRDSLGWTAELRIPFSQLRYATAAGERVWGVNFRREIARRGEVSYWAPVQANDAGFVSRFGRLAGIGELPRPRRLEVQPYALGRLVRAPGDAADPFHRSNDVLGTAGADVRYGITSDLTLTATLNPDFGQVEVDPAELNLSAFETFYSERRPFFLEGADAFQFGRTRANVMTSLPRLFYSRRIGQAPMRTLGGSGYAYVDAPQQTTIAGAAKLSGRLGRGWSVGVMDAVTLPEEARFLDRQGVRQAETVQPLSNYFVGRVRRDLGAAGWAGSFLTSVHRELDDPALAGMARSQAYVGGVDFERAWKGRDWILAGFVAGSHAAGSEEAIAATQLRSTRYFARPDAEHLRFDPTRTSLTGYTAQASLNGRVGKRWRGSAWYQQISPEFEANDLGFQTRADLRAATTLVEYRVNEPGPVFRDYGFFTWGLGSWNLAGDNLSARLQAGGQATFRNFWSVGGEVGVNPETYSDRLTWGGPLARTPAGAEWGAWVESDSRKSASFDAYLSGGADRAGGWRRSAGGSLRLRPSGALQVTVGPSVERSHGTAQYVTTVEDPRARDTFGRRYVFAGIDRTTLSATTRVNWTFSPTLSLQLFAQPYVASGDYGGYRELEAPRTRDFAVYGRDRGTLCSYATAGGVRHAVDPVGAGACPASLPAAGDERFTVRFGERDVNLRSLRGNAVLRWEYRPGSTLFLVWQQQRSEDAALGDFRFGRDSGALFRAPAENVFLVKMTYWLGY